jgi:hypothetical protein
VSFRSIEFPDTTGYDFSGIDIAGADAQGGGGGTPGYTSGTRIKQLVVSTADGASGFEGWYDSPLSVDCVFRLASDQQMRCMPTKGGLNGYYSDGGCMMPLATLPSCSQPPPFVFNSTTLTNCAFVAGIPQYTSYQQYAVGTAYAGSTFYYKNATTGCTMAPAPPTVPAGYALYNVSGTETPPSMFAAGTYSVQ